MTGRLVCKSIVAIFILSGCSNSTNSQKPHSEAIHGYWKIVYVEENGNASPAEKFKAMSYRFSENLLEIMENGETKAEWEYKLDPSNEPKQIDLKGGKGLGIYKLEGDDLTICAPQDGEGNERPENFGAPEGSDFILMKLRRK